MKIASHFMIAVLTFTLGVGLTIAPQVRANRRHVLQQRESILRANLLEMRKAIDNYSTEMRNPPRSLDQLVAAGYLREIPVDPITEKKDWEEGVTDLQGQWNVKVLVDVHSNSRAISSEGGPYNEW